MDTFNIFFLAYTLVYLVHTIRTLMNVDYHLNILKALNDYGEAKKNKQEVTLSSEVWNVVFISLALFPWSWVGLLTPDWLLFGTYILWSIISVRHRRKYKFKPIYKKKIIEATYISVIFTAVIFLKNIYYPDNSLIELITFMIIS